MLQSLLNGCKVLPQTRCVCYGFSVKEHNLKGYATKTHNLERLCYKDAQTDSLCYKETQPKRLWDKNILHISDTEPC